MNKSNKIAYFITCLLMFGVVHFHPVPLRAQSIKISLSGLNYLSFPDITGRLCIEDSSGKSLYAENGDIIILRNGVPMPFQLRCTKQGEFLSIIQVIDMSGSMSGRLNAVQNSVGILIDSMRSGDEMALVSFNSRITILQDFTTDKNSLKAGIGNIFPSGPTALYDALLRSLDMIAVRSGRKVLILASDGADNLSVGTLEDVMIKAKNLNVIVYTVGIGATSAPEQQLIRLALETGGMYFLGTWPSDLIGIYNELSGDIYSSCCKIKFTVSTCVDSLPSLFHLEYKRDALQVQADTILTLPWRPDTLQLTINDHDRLMAGQSIMVYIRLSPRLSPFIPFGYSFNLQYNPELLQLYPKRAVTLGTISQGKIVRIRNIAPGFISIDADPFLPVYPSDSLVGLRFIALRGDSSRQTSIDVSEPLFEQGCENVVMTRGDTLNICQCLEEIPVTINIQSPVYSPGLYSMSVVVPKGVLEIPSVFRGEIRYQSDIMRPVSIHSPDGDEVNWQVVADGIASITDSWHMFSTTDSVLLIVDWVFSKPKYPQKIELGIKDISIWSRCCYTTDEYPGRFILVEGWCEKIASARVDLSLSEPNPASEYATIRFRLGSAGYTRLAFYDIAGRELLSLFNRYLNEGDYSVQVNISNFPKGVILYALETPYETRTRKMVVR